MSINPARQVAYQVLFDVWKGQAFTNLALREAYRRVRLDPRDKGLCTELVYGTIQRQRSLDALIQPLVQKPLRQLDVEVLLLLRMSVYQLTFLDRVPEYAVIHESVEICKRLKPKASGFLNGVLRSFLRDDRPALTRLQEFASKAKSWAEENGILYSYPTWLVRAWEKAYGKERTIRIMDACNRPQPLSLRVNVMKMSREDALKKAQESFGESVAPSTIAPEGICLDRGIDVESWTLYQNGTVSVQDEGAMLISRLVNPAKHDSILDMCAAPGTKTMHLAELQLDKGHIDACDIHEHKLPLIAQAATRLGLGSVQVIHRDARLLADDDGFAGKYDAVLLDAPCSGFGVLRHRPDIRWKRDEKNVEALAELQKELLITASKLVRSGGTIVYSTCTTLPMENEQVVLEVAGNPVHGLSVDDIGPELPQSAQGWLDPKRPGWLLTPELFGTDGFYMARLVKR